jgi:CDP-diacylglycerol--glycerol-3-phosphate 3-phosphatidyltransferase
MLGRTRPGDRREGNDDAPSARRLEAAWRWWCLIGLLGLAATAALLRPAFGAGTIAWFLVNLLALSGVVVFLRRSLPRNRRSPDGPLLASIGTGNHATIARGMLIAQLPGYLLFPWPAGWQAWLPTVTFTLSLAADYLDGYLARRSDRVTGLGEVLDIEFDGLGLLAATALAVHYGQLPLVYFLTVGCARYTFLLAAWAARGAGRPVVPLPPSTTRRALAGVTMELGAAALWPIVPSVMITLAGAIVAVPFLAGFVRDGVIHLGWVDPASPTYLALRKTLVRLATVILPPVVRLAIVVLLGPLLASAAATFPQTVAAVRAAGLAAPEALAALGIVFCMVCLVSIAVGFAGRTGAVGIFIVYGLSLSLVALTARGVAAWGCAWAIYVFGTGPASLWQPERALYLLRAGQRA